MAKRIHSWGLENWPLLAVILVLVCLATVECATATWIDITWTEHGPYVSGLSVLAAIVALRRGSRDREHTARMSASMALMELIDGDLVRQARQTLYFPKGKGDEEIRQAKELVGRCFDRLGFLYRRGLVPREMVTNFYDFPVVACWGLVATHVRAERAKREQPSHFRYFEWLAFEIAVGHRRDGQNTPEWAKEPRLRQLLSGEFTPKTDTADEISPDTYTDWAAVDKQHKALSRKCPEAPVWE